MQPTKVTTSSWIDLTGIVACAVREGREVLLTAGSVNGEYEAHLGDLPPAGPEDGGT